MSAPRPLDQMLQNAGSDANNDPEIVAAAAGRVRLLLRELVASGDDSQAKFGLLDELLGLFAQFPWLTHNENEIPHNRKEIPSLRSFLKGKVPLGFIRALFALCSDPVRLVTSSDDLYAFKGEGIIVIAAMHSNESTIEFLLQKCKELNLTRKIGLYSPTEMLSCILGAIKNPLLSANFVKHLILEWGYNPGNHMVMTAALNMRYPEDFIEAVIEAFPSKGGELAAGHKLTLDNAKIFFRLIQKAEKLTIHTELDVSVFLYLMECLSSKTSAVKEIVHLKIPSWRGLPLDSSVPLHVLHSFRAFLDVNPTLVLHTVTLDTDIHGALPWLKMLGEFPSLKYSFRLNCKDFGVSSSGSNLKIGGLDFQNQVHVDFFQKASRLPSAMELRLQGGINFALATTKFIPELLVDPCCPTTLIDIKKPYVPGEDFNKPVSGVDLSLVYEALQHNSSLEGITCFIKNDHFLGSRLRTVKEAEKALCLKVLQQDNVTLRDCPVDDCPSIRYLLALNGAGRAIARKGNMEDIINVLIQANESSNPIMFSANETNGNKRAKQSPESDKLSILYGLLRVAPATWSK